MKEPVSEQSIDCTHSVTVKEGFVIWLTGLSGSGKSTLALELSAKLNTFIHTEILDGDQVRQNLSKGLSFSKEDRDENVNRIGFVANLIARTGGCCIVAVISPYKESRELQRQRITNFFEIYCTCPIEKLIERDTKGLYKKAINGDINHFTGINDPYEEPDNPNLIIDSNKLSIEESVNIILSKIKELFINQ